MKKFIFTLALLFSVVICANAQVAIEKSNALDNISVGLTAGASTPLEFYQPFKNLNPMVGISVEKALTPIFGFQLEGMSWLQDHNRQYFVLPQGVEVANQDQTVNRKWLKSINVGLNGKVNLTNLFKGYNGRPRVFEVGAVGGIGALFYLGEGEYLTAKSGLDFAFNLGSSRASSVVITPAVYWNLSGNHFNEIHFNKDNAQFALTVSYVYHFKNSNGTHYFKTYDVGVMNDNITYLRGQLDECEKRTPKVVEVEKVVERAVTIVSDNQWVVQFAQNSSSLTSEAKAILDGIDKNVVVEVVGLASPEGESNFNQRLSDRRASTVADYLVKRGVGVKSSVGKGVEIGKSTNRLAIITAVK